MKKEPYWLDTAKIKSFPALNRNVSVDVLVIGAGVTGITAAYLLKQSGLSVALIERERAAIRDTGHTTAHLTYVTDTGLATLQKNSEPIMLKRSGTRAPPRSMRLRQSLSGKRSIANSLVFPAICTLLSIAIRRMTIRI
jgi:choline dehydrogenase-like flavoprotein